MADASVRSSDPICSSRPCWLWHAPRPTPVTLHWWRCSRRLDCRSLRPPEPTSTTGARNTAAEFSTFDRCPYGADDLCRSRRSHRPCHRWPDIWGNRDQRLQDPHGLARHHRPPAPTRSPISSSQVSDMHKTRIKPLRACTWSRYAIEIWQIITRLGGKWVCLDTRTKVLFAHG